MYNILIIECIAFLLISHNIHIYLFSSGEFHLQISCQMSGGLCMQCVKLDLGSTCICYCPTCRRFVLWSVDIAIVQLLVDLFVSFLFVWFPNKTIQLVINLPMVFMNNTSII
jgi:hypothetical protein